MNLLDTRLESLKDMKRYPKQIFYSGNLSVLESKKISVVGSRKPTKYSRELIHRVVSLLSKRGVCIVSGGAIGIDAIAHKAAGAQNTIAVLPCGIDIKYPSINKNLLHEIEMKGLVLSQFDPGFKATPWSFVSRNETVVALGDILIVAEADINSGSMRSIEFALKMQKEIYVLPHRIGESEGTNELLKKGLAKAIYDVDEFVAGFGEDELVQTLEDDFVLYCKSMPSYDEALEKFPSRLFEAELEGLIVVKNSKVYLS